MIYSFIIGKDLRACFREGQYKQLYMHLDPYRVNKYSYSLEVCIRGLEVMEILCK